MEKNKQYAKVRAVAVQFRHRKKQSVYKYIRKHLVDGRPRPGYHRELAQELGVPNWVAWKLIKMAMDRMEKGRPQ